MLPVLPALPPFCGPRAIVVPLIGLHRHRRRCAP